MPSIPNYDFVMLKAQDDRRVPFGVLELFFVSRIVENVVIVIVLPVNAQTLEILKGKLIFQAP